jgi:hypothetical protein
LAGFQVTLIGRIWVIPEDAGDAGRLCIRFDELPDNFLAQNFAAHSIGPIHRPEGATF